MVHSARPGQQRSSRFDDELAGLDPSDPEAQAFAAHLDRMQHCGPTFTVEASIKGVADFAEGSHRAGGLRWWFAISVASLILVGVLMSAWDIVVRTLGWLTE